MAARAGAPRPTFLNYNAVDPGFQETLRLPLLAGRFFDEARPADDSTVGYNPYGDDARALLEGRSAEPAAAAATAEEARFIVQVGAFADADKAREARTKVERAGMKTYTQVVDTKEGKRTRVRVGPFTNRAEADKAAARIKALDLSASVLTL